MDRLIPDTGLALAVKSVLAVMRKLDPNPAEPEPKPDRIDRMDQD